MPLIPPDNVSGKADGAMRTIGEVSALLGVKPHILRYWEAQFDTLQPLKRAGGRRYYRVQDIAMLRQIDQLLNREGFTVRGARQFLAGQKIVELTAVTILHRDQSADLAALRVIRDQLAAALAIA